jgi:sugar/nucleoside kinase (ribokinase family)
MTGDADEVMTRSSRKESDPAVTVLGSLMVDLVWRPPSLPAPGQTVLAPGYECSPGGKGANQVRRTRQYDSPPPDGSLGCEPGPTPPRFEITTSRGDFDDGGKRVVQALSAKRTGVRTRMIGAIGDDSLASVALQVRSYATVVISCGHG